jgi:Ca2+-transporting ATPase|mmetsp:Transcript_22419/g.29998  ORF Transcript_22419/g.29998 Transcript_22419/m.29998 type:complete len:595 (+) Transcript_22419:1447-3231(+)
MGEPTEAAMKALAEKIGRYDASGPTKSASAQKEPTSYASYLMQGVSEVATLEFSSERKTMSTVIKGYAGHPGNQVLLKGAPERVIEKCSKIMSSKGEEVAFSADSKKKVNDKILAVASQGYRVLGIAIALDGGNMKDVTSENAKDKLADEKQYQQFEANCSFLGYVCIRDPPRPEVRGAIEECKTAGINVIMITGDAKETAVSIAKELKIIPENADIKSTCFTGAEFHEKTLKQKQDALRGSTGKVFSRVEPKHKRELVKILIEMGEIVAMTGDGVNDAPALKQAHIGVAMGITGTEVAKQASDMVLADDNFATIVKAVEEGRAIYSNMKAFIRYLISSNIGEVASIFFTAMLGIPESFNSVQLLWVNLVTDGPPATALSFNPPDSDIMKKPPRKGDDNLISNWVFFRYMVIGMYVGLATVGIFVWWYTMAETGDGHTLVSFQQLSNWSQCPEWKDFTVNNFVEGMDFSQAPCEYFTKGKVKASTLSLSVLVVIEMLNALNAISEDNSLMTMSPLVNPYLILAIISSILLHCVIVYIPFMNEIFSIYAMNQQEWIAVFAFSTPVIFIDEVLKFFGRMKNEAELKARLDADKKTQ